ALETRADQPEDRHVLRRPLDARLAVWGQAQVFDVTLDAGWGYSRHIASTPLSGTSRRTCAAGIGVEQSSSRSPAAGGRTPGYSHSMGATRVARTSSFSMPADAGCSAMRPSLARRLESGGHGCGGGAL